MQQQGTHAGTRRRGWIVAALLAVALALGVGWLTRTRPVFSERCVATVGDQSYSLEPDQTENAALMTAIALQRGLPARAASIAIATAIQESKLRNINYGDRDSIGLFQQRPSQGWGTVEEIMDPVYATNAFYDVLVKIEGYESLPLTDAAQQVQRSGFPRAYADHEPEARAFASAMTGHSPAAMTCRLRGASTTAQEPGPSGLIPRAQTMAAELSGQLGVTARPAGSGEQLVVPAGTGQRTWQVATWALAHAKAHDVDSIQTPDRVWERADGAGAQWRAGEGRAGEVVITLSNG